VRTTGRNLLRDLPIEYAKRVQAQAALESTSWHNDMLALSESIILNHAAALTSLRRQLNLSSNHGKDKSRWLHEVESFIDEVIEASGAHVRSSPELLRAVRWMIAGATAQFAVPTAPVSLDSENAVVKNAA
jgi:aspartyl/asparaginyl beta-hydroxylase (cupin superfamily)